MLINKSLIAMKFCIGILCILSLSSCVKSWDTEELEIFDLVEEINKNFYELMGITQEATSQEIKRAFRNLSIILHPDKSNAPDANIQFRNLVSCYEVLKDPSKREKYNKVLKDGLPNWKSALYYYRRMRKIGLFEGSLIILFIYTIGQYIFAWAAYLEKVYTAEQIIGSKLKKLQKKNKAVDMDSILNEIPTPNIFNTLPFQIPLAIWNSPSTIKTIFREAKELKDSAIEKRRLELEELQRQKELEEEYAKEKEARKEQKENIRKRRQANKAPEKTDAELAGYSQLKIKEITEDDSVRPVKQKGTLSGGFWTDDDLVELIRLVKKYPGGSSSRWDTIAESMNRSVSEVTFMAAKLKENGYRVPGQTDSVAENIVQEATKKEKVKTKSTNPIQVPETNWSQVQQRALEAAIVKYRKTGNADRWQKIANSVEGKTKEECLLRYKYLCDLVKNQKATKAENNDEPEVANHDVQKSNNNTKIENDMLEKEKIESDDEDAVDEGEEDDEEEEEKVELIVKNKGKRKNKRKERRRQRDFSSDDDSDSDYI